MGHPLRRATDQVPPNVIARRLTSIALLAAAGFGVLYAFGLADTLAGVW